MPSPRQLRQIRNLVRTGATRQQLRSQGFRFSNSVFQAIRGELSRIEALDASSVLRRTPLKSAQGPKSNRPWPRTLIVQSTSTFAHRYLYRAIATLQLPDGTRDTFPLQFGHDSRLTPGMVRARFRDMAERVANKGGRTSDAEPGRVVRIDLLGVLESHET